MELGLIKSGGVQIMPNGALYVCKLSDTLHLVKQYRMKLIGGDTKELTHQQYEAIMKALSDGQKFIKFKDGDMIAAGQIASIKPYEQIIDTRKDAEMITRVATTEDGQVRWYWAVREHQDYHKDCTILNNRLCGFKMLRYEYWNEDEKSWVLLPMENHATPEQEKVLDNINN